MARLSFAAEQCSFDWAKPRVRQKPGDGPGELSVRERRGRSVFEHGRVLGKASSVGIDRTQRWTGMAIFEGEITEPIWRSPETVVVLEAVDKMHLEAWMLLIRINEKTELLSTGSGRNNFRSDCTHYDNDHWFRGSRCRIKIGQRRPVGISRCGASKLCKGTYYQTCSV